MKRSLERITYKEVDGVIWADFAGVNKTLSEGRHHVLHEIIPQRNGLCLQ
jgi:hypothetical protein